MVWSAWKSEYEEVRASRGKKGCVGIMRESLGCGFKTAKDSVNIHPP